MPKLYTFPHRLIKSDITQIKNLIKYIENTHNDIHFQIICPDGEEYEFAEGLDIQHTLVDMERDFLLPKDIFNNFNKIKELEKQVDIIWMIDRSFPIDSKKPKLLSLNTLCYERELMSVFQSHWDKMVVLTDFVKNQIVNYVNCDELYEIPCYVDPIFLNVCNDTGVLTKYFDYNNKYKYLLFPHRPDPEKGHEQAIDILKKVLVHDKSYRLLIPLPPIAKEINIEREKKNIEMIKEYVKSQDLDDYVIFHNWVDYNDMPIYYKIGEFTLFLSKLPETSGLTLLNSVSVGTPVLSYGVGALNEVVPPGNSHFNIDSIDDAVIYILNGKDFYNTQEDIKMVKTKYNLDKIASQYVKLFKELKGE